MFTKKKIEALSERIKSLEEHDREHSMIINLMVQNNHVLTIKQERVNKEIEELKKRLWKVESFVKQLDETLYQKLTKNNDQSNLCKFCGGRIDIRNPTGKCDHLYWPDNLTDEAKRLNGFQ